MKYQLKNGGTSYTSSSVAAKSGITEENAERALDLMVKYRLVERTTVDIGVSDAGAGERLDIYSPRANHKLPLLIYPILSLAEKLSDFKENWRGFRG